MTDRIIHHKFFASGVRAVAIQDRNGQWAAYIGPEPDAWNPNEIIATSGTKLYETEARGIFPTLVSHPYRR